MASEGSPSLGSARVARIAIAIAAFAYALSALLAVPGFMAAGDSLYHFDVARKIWAGDLAPDPSRSFPWTVFSEWPVDHYWGFHVLTAPFAAFRSSELGMKVAASALFAGFMVVMHVVLVRRRVPFAWVWALASVLFSSQDWRYLQLRGGVMMAALALAFAESAFFTERTRVRRSLVVGLSALASISYNGALVLLPLHVAGIAGMAFDRSAEGKGAVRARLFEPLLTALGLGLGLLVNPYMDRRASTFRFAWFHVLKMGGDAENLFAGRENVEFNPFPLAALVREPVWPALLVFVGVAIAILVVRRRRGAALERDELVYGALTLAFIVLTARAVRLREYAVPLGFIFLALVSRAALRERVRSILPGVLFAVLLGGAAIGQWFKTIQRIPRVHPPIDLYAGARPVLEAHAGVPVANIVEGDSSMLLWEWSGVQAAHTLSPYFIYYRDRALYEDLRTLRTETREEVIAPTLDRIRKRGCKLVAARMGLPFHSFALRHPQLVRSVFLNPHNGTRIYEIVQP